MPNNSLPTSIDPFTPQLMSQPAHVERKIAVRWKEWEPWVIIHLRHRGYLATMATELARLRQWHRQHVLSLIDTGNEMRLIRKHQLDDPSVTDEVRGILMQAAIERRRKLSLGSKTFSSAAPQT